MNLSKLSRELNNTMISDSLYASKFVNELNTLLPEEYDIDVSITGNDLLEWFNALPLDLKATVSIVTLTPEEAQALKTELISLKEFERNKEDLDFQIKHNLVFAYTAVALAIVGFCVYAYLTTKGVDIEQTSQFLAGLKEVVSLLIDIGLETPDESVE